MNRLLIITVLVSSLGVSSGALSAEHMSLYTGAGDPPDIAGRVQGAYVEKDLMDFYISPIVPEAEKESPLPVLIAGGADKQDQESEYINVFGVMVPVKT